MSDAAVPRVSAAQAPPGPLLLAFSGGLDSSLLLHLLVEAGLGPRLRALHVNHQLQARSEDWAAFCRTRAEALGVPFEEIRISVPTGANLEAGARAARYQALTEQAAGATVITAHHRDDQAETVLLNLLRGAGVQGLAAMSEHSWLNGLPLWRPLLAFGRVQLEREARRRGLAWVEDPSNADISLRRNRLRHEILPRLAATWPGAPAILARTAGVMADAAALLDERAAEDARALAAARDRLPLEGLAALSRERQDNVLRWWLDQAGAPPPSLAVTGQIHGLLRAPADREASVTWAGHTLRRYRGDLYLLHDRDLRPLSGPLDWRQGHEPPDPGLWRLLPGEGEVTLWVPPGDVQLRPFAGGERLRRHGQHQQVSELWRVAGVPPWRRRQWPLLYQEGQLVSVPMIGVADGVDRRRCRPWQLRW